MTKEENINMHIMYTFNDNFVPQTAASIMSVLENNKSAESIDFYLIIMEVSKRNQEKLKKMIEKYHRKVHFIELKDLDSYFGFSFNTGSFHPIVLSRLLVDQLLPKNINRILYIDGDTICRGNLDELFTLDMHGKIIGMAFESTFGIKKKQSLGLENTNYYNAGVLLIDLKKWREDKIGTKIINFFDKEKDRKNFRYNDQDILNCYFKDKIFTLSPKYNYTNALDRYYYHDLKAIEKPAKYYSKDIIKDARKNPIIVHYLGEERPWRKYNTHKYRHDYKKYLNMTDWKDTPDEDGYLLFYIYWQAFNFLTKPIGLLRFKLLQNIINPIFETRKNSTNKTPPPRILNNHDSECNSSSRNKRFEHTFVVLAYQESVDLSKCIQSVLNQELKSNVVIATSTPNAFIKKIAKKYQLKLIINPKSKGISYDFDFASNCVNSELITIAHQDDIYEPSYSKNVITTYRKYPNASIIFTDYYEIKHNQIENSNINLKIKRFLLLPLKLRCLSNLKFIKRSALRLGCAICCPAVTFVTKNVPKQKFQCNMQCNIDWYAWEKLSKRNGYFIYIPKKLMGHRIHADSTTSKIITSNSRTAEDLIMLKKFWPNPIAKLIAKIYQKSEVNNAT